MRPPKKGESGCKGNNFRAYPPNFRGTFFSSPREPEGSFPKAGAKVGLITANAKLTGNFFGSFLDGKTQSTGKLGVRNKKKTKDGGKGERSYTIYNIITRRKDSGGTALGWWQHNAKLVAVRRQDGSGTMPGR